MQGPLNLITAVHDLLRRGAQADPALQHALRQATTAGQAALKRLRHLIPVGTLGNPVAPVNINQLLREVLELCKQRLLAGGMVVDWKPAPLLPAVTTRISRLRGMFKQLLDNALDAMEGNRQKPRELRIATEVRDQVVQVTIEYRFGIPELHWQVFEPFFTTKPAAPHTGLGLTLVQEVINEQNGAIDLDRDYTSGCRWHVLLPTRCPDAS